MNKVADFIELEKKKTSKKFDAIMGFSIMILVISVTIASWKYIIFGWKMEKRDIILAIIFSIIAILNLFTEFLLFELIITVFALIAYWVLVLDWKMVNTHITIKVNACSKVFEETITLTKRCSVEEMKNYAFSRMKKLIQMRGYSGIIEISKEDIIILWFYIEEDEYNLNHNPITTRGKVKIDWDLESEDLLKD